MNEYSLRRPDGLANDSQRIPPWVASECAFWPNWPQRESGPVAAAEILRLLWLDAELTDVPGQKAALALHEIVQTMQRTRPLAGAEQEFLDLVAWSAAQDGAAKQIWHLPQSFLWARIAFGLIANCLHGQTLTPIADAYCRALSMADPRQALAHHLEQFKTLVLGVALRSGADWTLERPLRTKLPLAIPGTCWSLVGDGPIEILGFTAGRLHARRDGKAWLIPLVSGQEFAATGLRLRECPVAHYAGYDLPLHPHAFHVPGLDISEPVLRAGLDYQCQHIGLVEQTLQNIERYAPALFAQFRQTIHFAALKPRSWGNYDDFSHPEFPGTFLASVIHNPLEMADHFIHEFQHNRLSLLEESGPLFDARFGDATTDAHFFSPWREKPRALYGIFHGVFVFIAVCRYWLAVFNAADSRLGDRAYVIDRLLRLPRQLTLAAGLLERHAHLTPLGRTIFQQLLYDVADVRRQVAAADLPADAAALTVAEDGSYRPERSQLDDRPLSTREAVLEHLRRNDIHQQCAGLLDELPAAAAA